MPKRRIRKGQDIRDERKRLGLTLEKTAVQMEVAVATLSRWEREVVPLNLLARLGIEAFFHQHRQSLKRKGV